MKMTVKQLLVTLLATSTLALGTTAFAQDITKKEPSLVTVVGTLDPKFSIEVSKQDIQKIASQLKDLSSLTPQTIDINDLMNEGDIPAIRSAAQTISNTFIDASKQLIDMKVLIYKLAALTSLDESSSYVQSLNRAYQAKFTEDYSKVINGFGTIRQSLVNAILSCQTELCAMQIGNAQIELLKIAKSISNGIDFKKGIMGGTEVVIKNVVVAKALEATMNQVASKSTGDDYAALIASGIAPFVSASKERTGFETTMKKLLNPTTGETTSTPLFASAISVPLKVMKRGVSGLIDQKVFSIVNHVQMASPDMGDLMQAKRLRFASILACGSAFNSRNETGGDWKGFVWMDSHLTGAYEYDSSSVNSSRDCVDIVNGNHYDVHDKTTGLGVGWAINAELLMIVSPIPLNSKDLSGTWGGIQVDTAPFFGAGLFAGKRGSIMIPITANAGGGVSVRGGAIQVEFNGSPQMDSLLQNDVPNK